MQIRCPSCAGSLRVKEPPKSRKVKCPKCGASIPLDPPTGPRPDPPDLAGSDVSRKALESIVELGGGTRCANCGGTDRLQQYHIFVAKSASLESKPELNQLITTYRGVLNLNGTVCGRCVRPILLVRWSIILAASIPVFFYVAYLIYIEIVASANRDPELRRLGVWAVVPHLWLVCFVPLCAVLVLVATPLGLFLFRHDYSIGEDLLWKNTKAALKEAGFPVCGRGHVAGTPVVKE